MSNLPSSKSFILTATKENGVPIYLRFLMPEGLFARNCVFEGSANYNELFPHRCLDHQLTIEDSDDSSDESSSDEVHLVEEIMGPKLN